MKATVRRIQRFPIKGLTAEEMDAVTLRAEDGIPGDRMYGFARHGSGFDPQNPKPLPKDRFVVLLKQAALAGIRSRFDPENGTLTLNISDASASFDTTDQGERARAALWLSDKIALQDAEPPSFVSATPHRFTDVSVVSPQMMNAISVLNLDSVRDLERRLQTAIDPARFRANIEVDGLPAWWELDNVSTVLTSGTVSLRIIKRTQRCAATEVNPVSAERDVRLPYLLRKEMGHMDMGVYVEVQHGGHLQVGDTFTASQ